MNRLFQGILMLTLVSCAGEEKAKDDTKEESTNKETEEPIVEDNAELAEIYNIDQADRRGENIDWSAVSERDSLREVRIYEMLDSNLVRTSKDYHNAAMIFQHGRDSVAYGMAVKLMRKSVELDSTANKWLLAAAIDRYLLSKDEPQIYGTQYMKYGEDEPWQMGKMDTTKVSDAERIEYGVETLAQQKEKLRMMNKKQVYSLLLEGKTIDELVTFINSEDLRESEYDLSESGINNLGYDLMAEGKNEDALKIFKLNTELYPNGFNTYDSYGECLMLLGRKEESVEAYKKSLELNPKNENAKTIVEENS